METKPLFETSTLGIRARVFKDKVTYRPFPLSGERAIPMSQIASVEMGMAGQQQVTIETTGGKQYKIVVRLRDKEAFRDAVLQAKG